MSQENRDERLGLTGLTPEQRELRIREMKRNLREQYRRAEAAHAAARKRRAEAAGGSVRYAPSGPPAGSAD